MARTRKSTERDQPAKLRDNPRLQRIQEVHHQAEAERLGPSVRLTLANEASAEVPITAHSRYRLLSPRPDDMSGACKPVPAYDFGWVRNHSTVAGIATLSGVA